MLPHELPAWALSLILLLALFCFAFSRAWMSERKYAKVLEKANNELGEDLHGCHNEICRLKRLIAEDASGRVARDPKTGRFIKEISA